MKRSRLIISPATMGRCLTLLRGGANDAYIEQSRPDIVYMKYTEDGKSFFTVLDREDCEATKGVLWEGFNHYVVKKANHNIYLHRVLCRGLMPGMIAHHKNHRFDNRAVMLEPTARKNHDQHRTYYGDLTI